MCFGSLVPRGVRNRLRPYWQKLRSVIRRKRVCASWPANREWKKARAELRKLDNLEDIYEFSQQHFGLIQIKDEILDLIQFARHGQPRIVGEIGLRDAGNAALFCNSFRELHHLVVLDVELRNVGKLKYLSPPRVRITALEGKSQSPEMLHRVRRSLDGSLFDLLFVDGDHSYRGVKRDFILYRDLVRPGGLMVFHDIVPDRADNGQPTPDRSRCYSGGVPVFWQEVRDSYDTREYVANWSQGGFGIGVIIWETI